MSIKQRLIHNQLVFNGYQLLRSGLTIISPTLSTKFSYRVSKGKPINLSEPKTLDEKISWLKLNTYYRNPLISQCADKYAVREYIESCGCPEILNELYGVYGSVDEIPWDRLPSSFVLKWNMGCGYNIICPNKKELDIKDTIEKLKKWGRSKFHLPGAEMQYKYIKRKITCEKYLGTSGESLPEDYKFYCFNGRAEYVMVCVDRASGRPKFFFFDRDWKLARINKDSKAAPEDFAMAKPDGIDEMFLYADKLSKPFPFVRADFYLHHGKIIFGELTFTPARGIDPNRLPETDLMLGKLLKLSN